MESWRFCTSAPAERGVTGPPRLRIGGGLSGRESTCDTLGGAPVTAGGGGLEAEWGERLEEGGEMVSGASFAMGGGMNEGGGIEATSMDGTVDMAGVSFENTGGGSGTEAMEMGGGGKAVFSVEDEKGGGGKTLLPPGRELGTLMLPSDQRAVYSCCNCDWRM